MGGAPRRPVPPARGGGTVGRYPGRGLGPHGPIIGGGLVGGGVGGGGTAARGGNNSNNNGNGAAPPPSNPRVHSR